MTSLKPREPYRKKSPRSRRFPTACKAPNNVRSRLLLSLAPIKVFFRFGDFPLPENDTQSKKREAATEKKAFLNVRKVCFYFHPKRFFDINTKHEIHRRIVHFCPPRKKHSIKSFNLKKFKHLKKWYRKFSSLLL